MLLEFSPWITPCRFVCVLSPVLVLLSSWNTLSLKPMLFSFIVFLFSSAKSAAGSACGTLSSGCFCGANTFVYRFSRWLESGAGGQGSALAKPLTPATSICRRGSGGTDSHFSLIYTHTWKYMLMLAFVKPRDKLPASGTWLFNSLSVHWFLLSVFFPTSAFQKASFSAS